MYKILIVEDDQTIAQTVAMHLEKWNYKTKTTEDLKNVLQEFLAFEPELVILDIMLPFFNGFYWCQKILFCIYSTGNFSLDKSMQALVPFPASDSSHNPC